MSNEKDKSILDGKPFDKADYVMDFERERKKEDAGISDKALIEDTETEDVSDNQNNQARLDYETNNQNSNEYKNNNDENQESQ